MKRCQKSSLESCYPHMMGTVLQRLELLCFSKTRSSWNISGYFRSAQSETFIVFFKYNFNKMYAYYVYFCTLRGV